MRGWTNHLSSIGVGAARAPGALTEAQAAQIAAALPGFAGTWSDQFQESCDGTALLVVTHEPDDRASFVIDATTAGIALGELRDDVLRPCGLFDDVVALIAVMRARADEEAIRLAAIDMRETPDKY